MEKLALKIFFCLTVIILSSCEKPDSNLPDTYLITKIDAFENSNHKLDIYKAEVKDFNQDELQKTPIDCKRKWKTEGWRKLDTTKTEEWRISQIIGEYTRLIESDDVIELIHSIENGSDIYIATCYIIMAKNTYHEHKFYERLYIFDVKNKKYYISKAQHGL